MKPMEFLESVPDFNKIVNRYFEVADILGLEEAKYCISEMIDGDTFEWYQEVANIAKQKAVTKVYDVGANIGIQRYFFESLGIEYIPVDSYPMPNINGSLDGLLEKKYPFTIHTKSDEALISHLCLGYLVKFKDCDKQLSKFDHLFFDTKMEIKQNKYSETVKNNEDYGEIFCYKKNV